MSIGTGEIKDEFLSNILKVDSYRIEYPELFKLFSINRENSGFEYVRLTSDRVSLIDEFCEHGFKLVCNEFEFVKDVSSFYKEPRLDSSHIFSHAYFPFPDVCKKRSSKFANLFKFDRFFQDEDTEPFAFKIKKQWIYNIFSGFEKDVLYLAMGANSFELIGFLSVRKVKEKQVRIDLIGVLEQYQGKGIASELINSLCLCEDVDKVIVGTQTNNIPAVNLYKKLGFQVNKVYTVLHRFNKGDS